MLAQASQSTIVNDVINHPDLIAIIAIGGGLLVGMIGIVCASITGAMKVKAREATKRELAAYIAEGTLDPDKAVELLNADNEDLKIAIGNVNGRGRGGCC